MAAERKSTERESLFDAPRYCPECRGWIGRPPYVCKTPTCSQSTCTPGPEGGSRD